MSAILSIADDSKDRLKYISQSWIKTNLIYLGIGILVGLLFFLLISAFTAEWIGWRGLVFQVLFSSIISLCVTNSIYLTQRLLHFDIDKLWLFILCYYAASLLGMLLAIELIYLVQSWLFMSTNTSFICRICSSAR